MDTASTSKISRVRGWLLIILGSCLSVGIAVIAAVLASTIAHNDQPGGSHWTGSHEFTVHVFELFGTVCFFGMVALAGGIFQLRHGRANRVAIVLMLALVAVMYFLGRQIVSAPH